MKRAHEQDVNFGLRPPPFLSTRYGPQLQTRRATNDESTPAWTVDGIIVKK